MNYRIVTRDGLDRTHTDLNFLLYFDSSPKETSTYKWRMNDWRPVTGQRLSTQIQPTEEGKFKPKAANPFATLAKQNYEQTTITKIDSDEVLAEVYRCENVNVLALIPNPYAAHTSTTTDQLPKARRSARQVSKPRPQGKNGIKKNR